MKITIDVAPPIFVSLKKMFLFSLAVPLNVHYIILITVLCLLFFIIFVVLYNYELCLPPSQHLESADHVQPNMQIGFQFSGLLIIDLRTKTLSKVTRNHVKAM